MSAARRTYIASLSGWTLLFVAFAAVTLVLCTQMSQMPGMSMPGGWTMSMMWMRMPGQSWLSVVSSFLGMWTVMMIAMMLPSITPVLARYQSHANTSRAIAMASAYFAVWSAAGIVAWCIGMIGAAVSMQLPELANAVPLIGGAVMIFAGLAQFSAWRTRDLVCCRVPVSCEELAGTNSPWRAGLRLGIHCVRCCANLTALLLVLGMMDLRAMTAITMAITLERLAPMRWQTHKFIGLAVVSLGLFTIPGQLRLY